MEEEATYRGGNVFETNLEMILENSFCRDRYTISYDNSDASVLRFRLNDGSVSPEPAYVETKASILRR